MRDLLKRERLGVPQIIPDVLQHSRIYAGIA